MPKGLNKADRDLQVLNKYRNAPWFSQFANLYQCCRGETLDWDHVVFVSTTVLVQARSKQEPDVVVREFVEMNIGASDFARHISLSQKKKGESMAWLFKTLIKRPFVEMAAASVSTVNKLTMQQASAFMDFHPRNVGQKVKQMFEMALKKSQQGFDCPAEFSEAFVQVLTAKKMNSEK